VRWWGLHGVRWWGAWGLHLLSLGVQRGKTMSVLLLPPPPPFPPSAWGIAPHWGGEHGQASGDEGRGERGTMDSEGGGQGGERGEGLGGDGSESKRGWTLHRAANAGTFLRADPLCARNPHAILQQPYSLLLCLPPERGVSNLTG
jgi:hypothetical protein